MAVVAVGFPCYILAVVAAAAPSSAGVDTPCYSAAFVHIQEVVVDAAVAVAVDQGDSLHLEERTAAAAVDTGREEDSWTMAGRHYCSPWAAAVGVAAGAGAILGTTVGDVYEYRRLDSGDDSKKNIVAGIDFLRVRVGSKVAHDHAIDLDCCCLTSYCYDRNGSDETTMDATECRGEIGCRRAYID